MKNNSPSPLPATEKPRPVSQEDQTLVPHKTDWLGIGQFAFSALGAFLLLGISLVSLLASLIQDSITPLGFQVGSDLSPYLFAFGLGGMGVLLIPSAFYAGRRLFTNQTSRQFQWIKLARISYLAPALILLGFGIQNGPSWAKGFLPFIHVLANTAAVFWLLGIARRKLPDQSANRFWGTVASGLGLTPLVTFILEILILIGIGLVWLVLMDLVPGIRQDLLDLATQFQNSSGDPGALQQALGVFVARRGVLFTLFTYVAFLIPVVEEFLKPAAVWLLLRRKPSSWEGFVIGATSGAGYALFENLTIGAAADAWTFLTLTRIGTATVHIFTAGLMGWGLASAFQEKKYLRMIGSYLGAVILHGAWNGLNILSAVAEFAAVQTRIGPFVVGLAAWAPAGLVVLALGSFNGLLRTNKYFKRAIMAGSNKQSEAAWKLLIF